MIPSQDQALTHSGRHLPYQPALDGMRALAVAAVLAYHAGLPWARGGFLGVDAFFVLSGYLITTLLLKEWQANGSITLTAFWARRARRLLPALFLVLLGVGAYALVFAKPDELDRLRGDALATLGYVANWRFVFSGQSYFEQFSVPSPLRHTWSLAIEEQWYAFWPLLVLAVMRLRRGSLGALMAVSLALLAASVFLMAWLFHPGSDPSRVYYGTDTRAQCLLVGALLSMLLLRRGPVTAGPARHMLQLAALACAVYIGWVWVTTSGNSVFLYRGGFLVLALAVAVVIAAVVQPKVGLLGRVLSLSPLRGLGIISYGVYLWHWPVYLVLTPDRTGWEGNGLLILRVAATLAIATASYYLIEKPVRRGVLREWRPSWVLAPAGAVSLAAALFFMTRGGIPAFAVPTLASAPMPESVSASSEVAGAAVGAPVRVLVIGDSVAWTMGQGLERVGPSYNLSVWNMGRLACGFSQAETKLLQGKWLPPEEGCRNLHSRLQSYVDQFKPDIVVALVGAADAYDLQLDGHVFEFGTPEADAYAVSELQDAVDVLTSQGAKVLLLNAPYSSESDLALDTSGAYVEPWRIDWLNRHYTEIAQERPGQVTLVDLNRFLSPDGDHADSDGGVDMRSDGLHLTPEGADIVGRWLALQILQSVGERAAPAPIRVMVLGDSVALSMAGGLERVGPDWGLSVWNRGGLGCGFLPADEELDAHGKWSVEKAAECKEWRSNWSSDVDAFQPDVVAFLFGPWDTLELKVEDRLLEVGAPEWRAYALNELDHAVDVLSSRGAKVMLITSPCFRPRDLALDAAAKVRLDPQRVDDLNDLYREFAQQYADRVVVADLNRLACPEGEYTDVTIDGVDLREDGVHFTPEGADIVARWLAPQIIAAVPEGRSPTPGVGASRGVGSEGQSLACWLSS